MRGLDKYCCTASTPDVHIQIEAVHTGAQVQVDRKGFAHLIEKAVSAALVGREGTTVKVHVEVTAVHTGSRVCIL